MTQLLPKGTIRRAVFEFIDRSLGWVGFRQFRTLSTICGEQQLFDAPPLNVKPCAFCSWMCNLLDKYVEKDHCKINAGEP